MVIAQYYGAFNSLKVLVTAYFSLLPPSMLHNNNNYTLNLFRLWSRPREFLPGKG